MMLRLLEAWPQFEHGNYMWAVFDTVTGLCE